MNRDISVGVGCIEEARDALRMLIRESGHALVGVHVSEVTRPESGLLGHQNALEVVARALGLLELAHGELSGAEQEAAE